MNLQTRDMENHSNQDKTEEVASLKEQHTGGIYSLPELRSPLCPCPLTGLDLALDTPLSSADSVQELAGVMCCKS